MSKTKNVLLVTNAATEKEILTVREAFTQAAQHGLNIRLSLVHVIPNLPTCYFNIPSMVLLTEQYYHEAKALLTSAGNTLGIARKDQWLITGRMKTEVLSLAEKLHAQFILASSISILDLHKTSHFKKESAFASIQSMGNFVA